MPPADSENETAQVGVAAEFGETLADVGLVDAHGSG